MKIATLSPAPSLEAGQALRDAACKLLKMAHRCPDLKSTSESSKSVAISLWSAEGYFAVLAEVAHALAYAQEHPQEVEPHESEAHQSTFFEQLREELSPSSSRGVDEAEEWPGGFDWLIRDVVDFAFLGMADHIHATHMAYQTACRELDIESLIASPDEVHPHIVVIDSWLDAFELVLSAYDRNHSRLS